VNDRDWRLQHGDVVERLGGNERGIGGGSGSGWSGNGSGMMMMLLVIVLTATSVTGAALVAHFHAADAALERPIADEAGQQQSERRHAAPASQTPRSRTGARPISAAHLSVQPVRNVAISVAISVASAVIEKRFDAAETRGVVDASVGRTQALVVTHPRRRKRTRRPARKTSAAFALGTDDRVRVLLTLTPIAVG